MPTRRAYRWYRWVIVSGVPWLATCRAGRERERVFWDLAPRARASARRRWKRSWNSSQVSRSRDRKRPSPSLGAFSMCWPCLTR
jgi:hypothetical protein